MSDYWWVPDEVHVWILAKKVGDELPNGYCYFVTVPGGARVQHPIAKSLEVKNWNPNQDETVYSPEDLVYLPDVNEGSILNSTRLRFHRKSIYTSCGSVLMSMNPFETIPNLYGQFEIQRYLRSYEDKLPSHLYLIPSRAYNSLCILGKNQTIFFSGESGAGKTEATKECLNFLTYAANNSVPTSNTSDKNSKKDRSISGRIIAASPVLEAFGNASTVRNPNSSRFGKFMELHFNRF